MKRVKKILCIMMSVVMISSVVMPISILAEDKEDEVSGAIEIVDSNLDSYNLYKDELIEKRENMPVNKGITFGDFGYEVLSDSTVQINTYTGSDATVNIPASIDGHAVSAIGEGAFGSCETLENITLPSTIKTIGKSAFVLCSNLKSIVIPDGVSVINDNTFAMCDSLSSVIIPKSVTQIGENAFMSCSQLKNVTIPNSVESIGSAAFAECVHIRSVVIPDSVKTLGEGVFSMCYLLTDVKVGKGIVDIDTGMFASCTALTNITFTGNIKSIGYDAFMDCSALKSIKLPNTVTTIGDEAFNLCVNLTDINIPDSVTSIGASAFSGCSKLTKLFINRAVTSIGDMAFDECGTDGTVAPAVFTVYVFEGSFAETYCKENGVNYFAYPMTTSIKLNSKSRNIIIGKYFTFKASISPRDAYKNIVWKSSNVKVATVVNGKVVAKSVGRTMISANAIDGSNVVSKVTVTVIPETVRKVKIKAVKKKATLTITKAKGAKKYEIYRSTKKKKGFKKVATVAKTKYVNKKLKSKKTYYYKVKAINGKYKAAFSKVYKVKVK